MPTNVGTSIFICKFHAQLGQWHCIWNSIMNLWVSHLLDRDCYPRSLSWKHSPVFCSVIMMYEAYFCFLHLRDDSPVKPCMFVLWEIRKKYFKLSSASAIFFIFVFFIWARLSETVSLRHIQTVKAQSTRAACVATHSDQDLLLTELLGIRFDDV